MCFLLVAGWLPCLSCVSSDGFWWECTQHFPWRPILTTEVGDVPIFDIDLAHINPEAARTEEKEPAEPGTSSQGETVVGQQGRATQPVF